MKPKSSYFVAASGRENQEYQNPNYWTIILGEGGCLIKCPLTKYLMGKKKKKKRKEEM